MLNTLVDTIVMDRPSKIVLVDVDSWDHTWLNRKYRFTPGGAQHIESTKPEADLRTRLEWWIRVKAEIVAEGDEFIALQAIDNISFISMDEFGERVPTAEMLQLMSDPVCQIG